jgi:enterochelin esterase family protein
MKRLLTSTFLLLSTALCFSQDTSLHDVLIDGEGWQEAVTGHTFADGLACDKEGNLYFSDPKAGTGIYKLSLDGKESLILDNQASISGVHVGADGRIYFCQGGKIGRVSVLEKDGTLKQLVDNVKPNDLIVTKSGILYFTETGTKSIHCIMPDGKTFVADVGHVLAPNGITLSADQTTLAVSEHGGKNVWCWQIQPDGKLTGAEPYMTMLVSPNNTQGRAFGDGATTDEKGRFYVTTELGIQVFDATGRLAGTIAKPSLESKIVSVEFAGKDKDWLFVCDRDKIYKRKTKTHGAWWSEAAPEVKGKK